MSSTLALNAPYKKRLPQHAEFRYNITNFDIDNLYPQKIQQIVLDSPVANRATLAYADFLRGNGFELNGDFIVNEDDETLNDLLRQVAPEKAMFDGYVFHVNTNVLGLITDLRVVPFQYTRYGLPDKLGKHVDVKVNANWEQDFYKNQSFGTQLILDFPLWGEWREESPDGFIDYVVPVRDVYPRAVADAVLDSAQTEQEIQTFELGGIQNGFLGTSIFRHPSKITDPIERKKVLDMLATLKGPTGASGIAYIEVPPSYTGPLIENLPANNNDTLFAQTGVNVVNRVLMAYGMPKAILGIQPESGMFNQEDIRNSYIYYNLRTRDIRNQIAESFNRLLKYWYTGPLTVGSIIENQFDSVQGRETLNILPTDELR